MFQLYHLISISNIWQVTTRQHRLLSTIGAYPAPIRRLSDGSVMYGRLMSASPSPIDESSTGRWSAPITDFSQVLSPISADRRLSGADTCLLSIVDYYPAPIQRLYRLSGAYPAPTEVCRIHTYQAPIRCLSGAYRAPIKRLLHKYH